MAPTKKWSGKQAQPSCPECRVELAKIAGFADWRCPKCGKEWCQAGMRLEESPTPTHPGHKGITSLADAVHRELSEALNSPELQAAREHVGLKPTVSDGELWEAMNGARELVGLGPMEEPKRNPDLGMEYAPQEDKEIPVARVGLGDDGTVTLEASEVTLGSPGGEPVVHVPLAINSDQARRQGGLVGHVVLGDGVVLPVIIPGMEQGIMSPMTPYTPLQASIVKVRDRGDGGADVNWESMDHLVGHAKDQDTLELHTHLSGNMLLSFEDVKDVAVRTVEEMDQATRDKLYLTHDGQPCPGTCVTLATELEEARAELREAKSGKVGCQVCGDNGSNGLCPACGRFQTPDTEAQVRERLVKTVGRLYEENGRLRDQLHPPPGKPVLDGELDPYTLVDSVLRNGCPECGKPVMIEAQVPEGSLDFAWAFTCAGLGRGIGTCGWWAISVVSLADAARVALRHPAATKEDGDDQAGD